MRFLGHHVHVIEIEQQAYLMPYAMIRLHSEWLDHVIYPGHTDSLSLYVTTGFFVAFASFKNSFQAVTSYFWIQTFPLDTRLKVIQGFLYFID